MTATIVTGMDPDGGLYRATLNGRVPVRLQPDALLTYTPDPGTPVVAGPVGVQLSFDVDDPAAVYAWLLGSTDVMSVEGPGLLPNVPGDLIFGPDDDGPPDGDDPTEPTPPDTTEPAHLADTKPEEGAMADTATIEQPEAPTVDVVDESAGEWQVRFPVMALEDVDTSDGRYLSPGEIISRALPMSILAQPFASHGGQEPPPSVVVGRLDRVERVPGPEVVSRRTGEPFPEGSFVWVGYGAIDPSIDVHGLNIGNLLKRRFLNGASVDLAGMDYEIVGEGGLAIDPEHPRRELVTLSAEIAAITLCPIPAFSDAYVELVGDEEPFVPVAPEDLPNGFCASAFPAWRSAEVGDYAALPVTAAADEGMPVRIPPDSVEQLAAVIDSGTERDATELATAIVEHIAQQWALEEPVTEEELPDDAVTAAGEEMEPVEVDEVEDDGGFPESPQPCQYGPEAAVESLVFREGDAYVPVCADHRTQADEELAAAGEVVAEVVPIEADDEDEPDDEVEIDGLAASGTPDAPQGCEFTEYPTGAEHPASLSLLFSAGSRYAAVCADHEQAARDLIDVRGDEVTGTVTIGETP